MPFKRSSKAQLEPNPYHTEIDKHIRILEDRFIFAARRYEQLCEENPLMTETEMWAIQHDLAEKKRDLEQALDAQRRLNRKKQEEQDINNQQ